MFRKHKIASGVGVIGIVPLAGHLLLGPDIIPPTAVVAGAIVVATAATYIAAVTRSRSKGPAA